MRTSSSKHDALCGKKKTHFWKSFLAVFLAAVKSQLMIKEAVCVCVKTGSSGTNRTECTGDEINQRKNDDEV